MTGLAPPRRYMELVEGPSGRWHWCVYDWTGELVVHGWRDSYTEALTAAQGWLR